MAMAGCDEHRNVSAFAISTPATIYSTITENCFRLRATFATENKPFYLLVYISGIQIQMTIDKCIEGYHIPAYTKIKMY